MSIFFNGNEPFTIKSKRNFVPLTDKIIEEAKEEQLKKEEQPEEKQELEPAEQGTSFEDIDFKLVYEQQIVQPKVAPRRQPIILEEEEPPVILVEEDNDEDDSPEVTENNPFVVGYDDEEDEIPSVSENDDNDDIPTVDETDENEVSPDVEEDNDEDDTPEVTENNPFVVGYDDEEDEIPSVSENDDNDDIPTVDDTDEDEGTPSVSEDDDNDDIPTVDETDENEVTPDVDEGDEEAGEPLIMPKMPEPLVDDEPVVGEAVVEEEVANTIKADGTFSAGEPSIILKNNSLEGEANLFVKIADTNISINNNESIKENSQQSNVSKMDSTLDNKGFANQANSKEADNNSGLKRAANNNNTNFIKDFINNYMSSSNVILIKSEIEYYINTYNNWSDQQREQFNTLIQQFNKDTRTLEISEYFEIAELPQDKFNIINYFLYIPDRGERQMCINPLFDLLNLPNDKLDLAKQLAYIKGRDEYSQFEGDEICKLLSLTNEQYDIAKQYLVIDNFDEQIDADTLCCIAKMNPEDRMKLDDVLKQGNSDITFRALPGGKLEIVYNGEDGSIKTVQIPSNIEENYKVDGNNIYDEHIKYDKNGNIVEITRIQPSDIEGYDNITVEKDGKVYELQKAYRDETTGEIVVVQNMVSPNGTTTKSEYRRKDDGSYTMKYTITDSNGNVILERNQSFTRVSDTKTLTQIDGKTYTAEFFDDHFIITDSDNNKYSLDLKSLLTDKLTRYCYINDEEGKKIIDMLKNVSADKLITLTKEGFYVTPSLNSTANNDYGINLDWNDDLNDMTSMFLHEMGHYLDSENEEYTVVCENASVQEVFNKELEAFNANTSGNWQYILSHIVADLRSELVAEANMIINGYKRTDELRLRAILYQQYFPETIANISKLLDNRIEAKIDQYRDQQTNYYADNNNNEENNEDLAQNEPNEYGNQNEGNTTHSSQSGSDGSHNNTGTTGTNQGNSGNSGIQEPDDGQRTQENNGTQSSNENQGTQSTNETQDADEGQDNDDEGSDDAQGTQSNNDTQSSGEGQGNNGNQSNDDNWGPGNPVYDAIYRTSGNNSEEVVASGEADCSDKLNGFTTTTNYGDGQNGSITGNYTQEEINNIISNLIGDKTQELRAQYGEGYNIYVECDNNGHLRWSVSKSENGQGSGTSGIINSLTAMIEAAENDSSDWLASLDGGGHIPGDGVNIGKLYDIYSKLQNGEYIKDNGSFDYAAYYQDLYNAGAVKEVSIDQKSETDANGNTVYTVVITTENGTTVQTYTVANNQTKNPSDENSTETDSDEEDSANKSTDSTNKSEEETVTTYNFFGTEYYFNGVNPYDFMQNGVIDTVAFGNALIDAGYSAWQYSGLDAQTLFESYLNALNNDKAEEWWNNLGDSNFSVSYFSNYNTTNGGSGTSSCDRDSILYNHDPDIDWKNVGLDMHDLLGRGVGDSPVDENEQVQDEEL